MKNKNIPFERPLAAPIFRPTNKEFENPLDYIEKIRPEAQKHGICKIIPPKQWNPPFAVDRHSFKFRPRVQRLNEVGAHARIKNNFVRCLESYSLHQKVSMEPPLIKSVKLDVFELHKIVQKYGGTSQVTKKKQWTQICRELGYGDKAKQMCSVIHGYFDRTIQPYLNFCDEIYKKDNPELFAIQPMSNKNKTAITLESPKMTRSKAKSVKKAELENCTTCKKSCPSKQSIVCVECELKYHRQCEKIDEDVEREDYVCRRCLQINCQRELARLDAEVFGFSQSTCKYSLDSFNTYADKFKCTYFGDRKVTLKEVEEEYWRLIAAEDNADDVVVKYGADISSSITSSGFPTVKNQHLFAEKDQKYVNSGWNLNNLPVLNKSIFRFVPNDISGMTVPWCYVGMVFSCFCWHIEDHWSYSINYMHYGDCKTWYGIPESDADNFEALMQQEAKQLFDRSPDLLHHITTQMNPGFLMNNDVQVYRTDQAAGEFVVTFPRAYHAGFNQGFNFAEAVNFCPADWLSKGRASVASYRDVKRPSVFSHNELICKMAARIETLDLALVRCLLDELVAIQQEEKASRRQLCSETRGGAPCRTERLHPSFDNSSEQEHECLLCRTTLYISGVSCTACFSCPSRMTCLDHVRQVCQCSSTDGLVLRYRYSLDEISVMVAAVRGRLHQFQLWMSRVYLLARCHFSTTLSSSETRVMHNVAGFIETLHVLSDHELAAAASTASVSEKPNLEELKMLLDAGKSINCPSYLLDFLEDIIETCQRAMAMTDELLKSVVLEEPKIEDAERATEDTGDTQVADDEHEVEDNKENVAGRKSRKVKQEKQVAKPEAEEAAQHKPPPPPHVEKANKLTLREMRLLVEKLHSLPAHVPQLEQAAQILCLVNEWRQQLRDILQGPSSVLLDSASLSRLLDHSTSSVQTESETSLFKHPSSIVYMPEYHMIQRMLRHIDWICKANKLMCSPGDSSNLPSLDDFRQLRNDGLELVNTIESDKIATMTETLNDSADDDDSGFCPALALEDDFKSRARNADYEGDDEDEKDDENEDRGSSDSLNTSGLEDYRMGAWVIISTGLTGVQKQLNKIIGDGENMQKKAEEILDSSTGKFALFTLNSLLKSANADLKCSVSSVERLKTVVDEAVDLNSQIQETWHKLQQARRLVHIDDLHALLARTDNMCVTFEHVVELRALAGTVEAWRENLRSLFTRPSTVLQLPTPSLLEVLMPRPARQFRMMISRETTALSSKLVTACRAPTADSATTPDEIAETCSEDQGIPPASASSSRVTAKKIGSSAAAVVAAVGSTTRNKRASTSGTGTSALSADDPLSARLENVHIFESYLRNSLTGSEVSSSGGLGSSSAVSVGGATSASAAAAVVTLATSGGVSNNSVGELDFFNHYKSMCLAELEWMWNLRQMNEEKANKDSNGRDLYCVCRKRGTDQKGTQVMCDLCQDWLHLVCLGLAQHRDLSRRKFLCPQCERSRRPTFELVTAEKRKLDQEARLLLIPEHTALCLMCQRIINFHRHNNQLFSPHTELGAAFAEYKRIFGVQSILPDDSSALLLPPPTLPSATLTSLGSSSEHAVGASSKQSRKTPHGSASSKMADLATGLGGIGSGVSSGSSGPLPSGLPMHMQQQQQSSYSSAAAASIPITASTTTSMISGGPPSTPMAANSKEARAIIARLRSYLSDEARRELEETYIELCLLEVNLATSTWVWKLYHSLIVDEEDANEDEEADEADERLEKEEERPQGAEHKQQQHHHQRGGRSRDEDKMRVKKRRPSFSSSSGSDHSSRLSSSDEAGPAKLKRISSIGVGGGGSSSKMEYMKRLLASKQQQRQQQQQQISGSKLDSTSKFSFKRKLAATTVVATGKAGASSSSSTSVKRPHGGRKQPAPAMASGSRKKQAVAAAVAAARLKQQKQQMYGDCGVDEDDDDDDDEEVIHLDKQLHQQHKPRPVKFGVRSQPAKKPRVPALPRKNRKIQEDPDDSEEIAPKRGRRSVEVGATAEVKRRRQAVRRRSEGSGIVSKRNTSGGGGGNVCNDDCAADHCVQHSSDKVNWVACDRCDLWFHWLCVGINSKFELDKRFLCPRCSRESSRTSRQRRQKQQHGRSAEGSCSSDVGAVATSDDHQRLGPPAEDSVSFLAPDCEVLGHEEEVELSYVSRSSSRTTDASPDHR